MSLLGAAGMAGDIWSTGAFSFESPLKELIDSGDYTLEQLLAEDELLQELRGVHPQLIQFFSTPEAVTKLVQYVILPSDNNQEEETGETTSRLYTKEPNGNAKATVETTTTTDKEEQPPTTENEEEQPEPSTWLNQPTSHGETTPIKAAAAASPENDPELKHIRFPYMACEIICCEINPIIDILVDGHVPTSETTLSKEETTAEEEAAADASKEEEEENDGDETKEDEHTSPPPQTRILDLLFSVLYDTKPGELDDYRAGYFDKILTVLFRKRPEELSKYINEGGSKGTDTLMKAMFSHLYSHSIMQIAQRLMLPQRPTPPQPPSEEDGAEITSEEQGMMMPEDDPGVMCDWSKSSHALDMLLESLIHPEVPSAGMTEEVVEESRLDLSLNASEVLITIIQNSMLSSETMLSLTSPDTIQRVVEAATTLRQEKDQEPYFSPHESLLTSAMNVLESLILQLGGYGAVGTMFLLPEEEAQGEDGADESKQLIADLGSMADHLPVLLDAMANLLRHPSTSKWVSPMQFSKEEPQQLLGSSRLRIVRVLESLVLLGDPEIDSKLVQSDCLEICLDLFWEFQWCSMLHQSVANLLVHVFEGQNARIEMQEYFLLKCNLLGRLMDSFLDIQENARIADVVMNLKDMNLTNNSGAASSAASERGSTSDPLPISEDDVEAAMEQQEAEMSNQATRIEVANVEQVSTEAVRFESRDASTIGAAAPAQSFRFGYMGHVIIICQALVHACSNELDPEEQQMQLENEDGEYVAEIPNNEPLMLAELVANHDLAERWREFVATTLASETAIQSTALGGYITAPSHDPLHSHRPGPDDGDMGDDGMGPPAPPRGMLGGGDVIDMDDNDLDIAASMMVGLNLQRPSPDSDGDSGDSGSMESGDSEKSYNSGETAKDRTGYAFDDPLGKAGALGIELGKLTQYNEDGENPAVGGDSPSGENDEDDNSSSSDEEPNSRSDSAGEDVPVMDLFAGNFDYDQESSPNGPDVKPPDGNSEEWTNFANFEQAEATFGDLSSQVPEPAVQDGSDSSSRHSDIEEIFGTGDHADLLEDPAPNTEPAAITEGADGKDFEAVSQPKKEHSEIKQDNDARDLSEADANEGSGSGGEQHESAETITAESADSPDPSSEVSMERGEDPTEDETKAPSSPDAGTET